LKIFFGEVIPKEADLDFLVRLANKSANQRIEYREFCKFLSKRMVRTFKLQGAPANDGDASAQAALGTVQRELERPLSKEATMSYALRKSAELHLDLRKILVEFDKNELNVIPRSKFIGILMDLPLGLAESEIHEILENDLHFDNYGNVDYTIILNSDLFCHLERQRLKTNYKKRKGIRVSIGEAPKQEE
jgi:Ca2+-binding EF-hand superfamily protein